MRRTKKRKIRSKRISSRFSFRITGKIAIIVVGILVVLQIFTAIQTSSTGAVLADLEKKEMELIKQNEELAGEIIDQNSLISIREKSEELGFLSPQATFYITEQDTVALLK